MAAGRASPPDLVPAAEPVSPVRTNKESATTIRNTTKSVLLCRLCIMYFGTWEHSTVKMWSWFYFLIIIVILQTWICCNAGLGWTPLPLQTSGKKSFTILVQITATLSTRYNTTNKSSLVSNHKNDFSKTLYSGLAIATISKRSETKLR